MASQPENLKFMIWSDHEGWCIRDCSHTIVRGFHLKNNNSMVWNDNSAFEMEPNGNQFQNTKLKQYQFDYRNVDWKVEDRLEILESGIFKINRSWINISPIAKEAAFLFEIATCFQPDFYLIPCVSYNGNKWGEGGEPKGFGYENEPWIFAYNRTSLPAATFSENEVYSVGMFASDSDKSSLESSCSLVIKDNQAIHRIYWPVIEKPLTYSGRDQYKPPVENRIKILSGEQFKVTLFLAVSTVSKKNMGWTKAYDDAAYRFKKDLKPWFDAKKVWELGIEYVKKVQLTATSDYSVLEMGLLPQENLEDGKTDQQWRLRTYDRYEIGWCGQNAMLSNALIFDYLLFKHTDSLDIGIAILDTWVKYACLNNGLFYIKLDDVFVQNTAVLIDTCNLGWGAWQMLKAYVVLKNKVGIEKPEWLQMGLRLCDFFNNNRLEDGTFGKIWNNDGVCVDEGGTAGAFVLLPFVKAFKITGEEKYLQVAIKAFQRYISRDLEQMKCTAGALDTCCVDKESAWPLLKTALDLYDLTGENSYLENAITAGYYTVSWMFHYNVLVSQETDFYKYGYQTYGGTAVSTQHHHLDPWGALLCSDWLRLYKHTGDERWKIRAWATWINSLQGISDGTLEVHGIKRPAGSQNEAYFQCNWGFNNQKGNGQFNDWLVSWPGAFRLLTLMREDNWELFDEIIFSTDD